MTGPESKTNCDISFLMLNAKVGKTNDLDIDNIKLFKELRLRVKLIPNNHQTSEI